MGFFKSSVPLPWHFGSRVRPLVGTRVMDQRAQAHIRSPVIPTAPSSRILRLGLEKTGPFLTTAVLGHTLRRSVHPDPPRLIIPRWNVEVPEFRARLHTVFMAAPSITTPLVTYFHKATSSFLASATIVTFLARDPSRRTRLWNHRASAVPG